MKNISESPKITINKQLFQLKLLFIYLLFGMSIQYVHKPRSIARRSKVIFKSHYKIAF